MACPQLAKTPSPSTSTLPLFAAYLYERRLYLVLRYCAGGSIRAGESWKEGDVACVAESILLGLRTMHQLGCVHHDIKPDNLLLMDGGSPPSIVIADYGTSLIIDERGKGLIATGGTPGYAPPEWMGGECDYSTASDVFATGVTVTVLLAAAFPFNFEKVYEKVMAGAKGYKLDPELVRLDEKSTGFKRIMSEGAKDFVRKCCAFDPEDRWTVEQLLDHEWLLRYGRGKGGGRALSFLASEINSVLKRMELGTAVEHGLRRGAAASDIADPAAVEVIRQKHIQENALRAEFHKLVSEGNELKLPEFKVMMARLGCDHLLLDRLFGAFDSDDSGGISLPELIVGLGLLRQTEPHERAELVLRMYSDADGFITVAGITDALQSVAHRYSNHPMFKASETRMKEVLIELCGESRDGRVASADLKEAIMSDRRLLRLFLAPAAAVHEKDRLERESEEWGWAVSAFGEASVTNWHRSIYLVLLLFVTVTLLMHFVGVLDVDAVGSWLMRQLVRASDAMGAVDGDGGSAGDLDFVMDASGTAAVDVA